MRYPRIVLAGTHSGAGKTTVTLGILLALRKRRIKTAPFKAGPDYIDPSYHTFACQNICRNLDTWMLSDNVILELFKRQASSCDMSLIEGAMGLYDGIQGGQRGSSAHLAKLLKSPVILVVDGRSMSTSAGAVVLGYQKFDKDVVLQGVILNRISSRTHYQSAKEAIEKKTKIPVLGFLPNDKQLLLPERHLGLIPAYEKALTNGFSKRLLRVVESNIDIDRIIKISQKAPAFIHTREGIFSALPAKERVVIAVAKDKAFNFYYQDNLDILSCYGADIVEFSPLGDRSLPGGACGIYIGGGFPELFAEQLSKNIQLKDDILKKAKDGMPIYAECGGLMYLLKRLIDSREKKFEMIGIFNATAKMSGRLRALGYVNIEVLKRNILSKPGDKVRAHMFHWSYFDNLSKKQSFAYKISKPNPKCACLPDRQGIRNAGCGIKEKNSAICNPQSAFNYDGLMNDNVLASYSHLHFGSNKKFAQNFVRNCRGYKDKLKGVNENDI